MTVDEYEIFIEYLILLCYVATEYAAIMSTAHFGIP
jgi:hypothetical protein